MRLVVGFGGYGFLKVESFIISFYDSEGSSTNVILFYFALLTAMSFSFSTDAFGSNVILASCPPLSLFFLILN